MGFPLLDGNRLVANHSSTICYWSLDNTPYVLLALFQIHRAKLRRSLGQRAMRIAIVHDRSLLGIDHWGRRAFYKIKYVIPFIGVFLAPRDEHGNMKQKKPVDLANHTVAVDCRFN